MNADLIRRETAAVRKAASERIDLTNMPTDQEILHQIMCAVLERSSESYLTAKEKRTIIHGVFDSMRRLDVIQPLMEDPSVTEIMINGYDNIFVERNGFTSRTNLAFDSLEVLENVIQSVVARVNRTVNESTPIVDARMPDGSRVHVVLPPIALNGPTMTIRKFGEEPFTMEQLIRLGTITDEAADLLRRMAVSKYNIMISGGTGSGKTTFLNVLSGYIPAHERIITIEDSAELQLTHVANLVSLETRNANSEGKGEVTIRELIRASLRMRPDRIIVGEVRGPEALDMLQAMNTGHDGSLSTGHANSTGDMLSRLETMVLSGTTLPVEVIRKQIASAVDVIIQLSRLQDGTRKVVEIAEVTGYAGGEIEMNRLFIWENAGVNGSTAAEGRLRPMNGPIHTNKLRAAGKL